MLNSFGQLAQHRTTKVFSTMLNQIRLIELKPHTLRDLSYMDFSKQQTG